MRKRALIILLLPIVLILWTIGWTLMWTTEQKPTVKKKQAETVTVVPAFFEEEQTPTPT